MALNTITMVSMFVSPQISHVGVLTPNVMVSEDEAFGRRLSHEDGAILQFFHSFIEV